MLLLGLCGVDEEIISQEYSLSNLGYWGNVFLPPQPPSMRLISLSLSLSLFLEPEEELEKKSALLGTTIENLRMVMSAP
jgi:hypothetical protein